MPKLARSRILPDIPAAPPPPAAPRPRLFPVRPLTGAEPRREYDLRPEIRLAWVLLAVTLAASGMVGWELAGTMMGLIAAGETGAAAGHGVFAAIVGMLIYGNFVFQLTRLGYLRRRASHLPAARRELENIYGGEAAHLAVLIPSYKEEPAVVRRTLLSAALQDYPSRSVVLLIDDPAYPARDEDVRALRAMEALPATLQRLFDAAAAPFDEEYAAFSKRQQRGAIDPGREALHLAWLYNEAALKLSRQLQELDRGEPGEKLLAEKVFVELLREHRFRANELRSLAHAGTIERARVEQEYHRLACLFRVRFSSFQRKRYVNLPHEPNKAMNLNTYIGLMGGSFRELRRDDGLHLEPAEDSAGSRSFPDADYLITLDADSLLLPDYALRLIHLAQQPGNERLAVIQTPYSSIPAPAGSLEYVAGATTDIQYIIHQGFTAHRATYWVGANALLRKRALHDIAEQDVERGFPVTRYIQDRTVIEDTESSIDLVAKGWQLHNYPERLAYSATPPDFGSLLIQRRRWANGGLIILPKLLRHLLRGPERLSRKLVEGFFRTHYLISIAAVNIGLLVLFAFPFEESLRSFWLPLSALPYFYLYARELAHIGYRWSDVFRVYALNLLLIPVNLGGVLKSLQQAWTRAKIPFGRTPKVEGRTAAPALYVAAEFAMLGWWLVGATGDFADGHYAHVAFALLNAAFLAYAIRHYLGFRPGWEDLVSDLGTRFPRLALPLMRAG
jgi:cellulose synthase/poly-beta-1,6-N-acetylglucosamine synthase-like glycosyltransferase